MLRISAFSKLWQKSCVFILKFHFSTMSPASPPMIQLVLIIYISNIVPLSSINRFTSIQPSNPSHSGIATTYIHGVSITDNKWHLFTLNEHDFNMHISLDNTWSFDATEPTTLQIQIGNDYHVHQPTSLLIVFSQNNKYFTFILDKDKHLMFPNPTKFASSTPCHAVFCEREH